MKHISCTRSIVGTWFAALGIQPFYLIFKLGLYMYRKVDICFHEEGEK